MMTWLLVIHILLKMPRIVAQAADCETVVEVVIVIVLKLWLLLLLLNLLL